MHRALALAVFLNLFVGRSDAQESTLFDRGLLKSGESINVDPEVFDAISSGSQLDTISTQGLQKPTLALAADRDRTNQSPSVSHVFPAGIAPLLTGGEPDSGRFRGEFTRNSSRFGIGTDLYSAPEFEGGLIVYGEDVAMKIGGYVKADFIYDFDPIDSTDSFNTTDIEVGAPGRSNTRFHARQTRLSFDTRWLADENSVRIFVEGDFFGSGNSYRLRHAYGEIGSLLVGQTWTTFTDVAAAPATLDFEGSVSSVNRRQAMVRWTQPVFHDDLTLALAVEDTKFIVIPPSGVTGDARSPSPDLIARLRLSKERMQFQIAGLYRLGGFQPTDESVITRSAWGLNFTGTIKLTDHSKVYHQIVFGEGIGSYRSLPDAVPSSSGTAGLLGLTGWMVGYSQELNDRLTSNFTYAENALDNTLFQNPGDVHRTTYLAANLVWSPVDRVRVGVEYLFGVRENIDSRTGVAHRIQTAFIFDLP